MVLSDREIWAEIKSYRTTVATLLIYLGSYMDIIDHVCSTYIIHLKGKLIPCSPFFFRVDGEFIP